MTKFKDNKDREWRLKINIRTIKEIKSELGFDFLKNTENSNPILELASDYLMLADVLWTLVKYDAEQRNVTVDDFVESIANDSIDDAINALAVAYTDFIPNPKRRETMTALWEKVRQAETKVLDKAAEQVAAADMTDGV